MNATNDLLCTDALGNAGPPHVNKTHDVTPLSTRLTHYRHLSTCSISK